MAIPVTVLSLQRTKIKIQYFTIRHPVNRPHPQRLKLVKLSQSNNCIMNSLSKLYAWRSQRLLKSTFDLNDICVLSCLKKFLAVQFHYNLIVFFSFQMYNAKLKSSFDEVKRIAFHIEKAVRHKKVFCLGGSHFPSARKVNQECQYTVTVKYFYYFSTTVNG